MDNGLWTEKFSDIPITGGVYGYFGENKPYKKVHMGNIRNGKKEGKWVSYHHSTGRKSSEENWKDGKLNGLSTFWYEDGQKAAEGISSLVLDVKFGRGAFMEDIESARVLSESMVGVSNGLGVSTIAVLSSMNQPIGYSVGNSLEILESVETLLGRGPADLEELVCVLGGLLLESSGYSKDFEEGAAKILDSLYDGSAFGKFIEMVASQGGDPRVFESEVSLLEGLGILDQTLKSDSLEANKDAWIADIDAMAIAEICLEMGAGRLNLGDKIDHQVGVVMEVQVGDTVEIGDILATVYHRGERIGPLLERLGAAFSFSDSEPDVTSRIAEVIR